MTSAGVDLTKEQKEALARALGQKPVKVAFAFGLDAATPDRKPGSETGNDRKPRKADPRRGIEWRTRKQAGRDGLTPKNLGIGIKGPPAEAHPWPRSKLKPKGVQPWCQENQQKKSPPNPGW